MEFNIEELRKQKRPLWMTNLAVESVAEYLSGPAETSVPIVYQLIVIACLAERLKRNATQKMWNSFLARTGSWRGLYILKFDFNAIGDMFSGRINNKTREQQPILAGIRTLKLSPLPIWH